MKKICQKLKKTFLEYGFTKHYVYFMVFLSLFFTFLFLKFPFLVKYALVIIGLMFITGLFILSFVVSRRFLHKPYIAIPLAFALQFIFYYFLPKFLSLLFS